MNEYNITLLDADGEPHFASGNEFLIITWNSSDPDNVENYIMGAHSVANLAMALARDPRLFQAVRLAEIIHDAMEKEEEDATD